MTQPKWKWWVLLLCQKNLSPERNVGLCDVFFSGFRKRAKHMGQNILLFSPDWHTSYWYTWAHQVWSEGFYIQLCLSGTGVLIIWLSIKLTDLHNFYPLCLVLLTALHAARGYFYFAIGWTLIRMAVALPHRMLRTWRWAERGFLSGCHGGTEAQGKTFPLSALPAAVADGRSWASWAHTLPTSCLCGTTITSLSQGLIYSLFLRDGTVSSRPHRRMGQRS